MISLENRGAASVLCPPARVQLHQRSLAGRWRTHRLGGRIESIKGLHAVSGPQIDPLERWQQKYHSQRLAKARLRRAAAPSAGPSPKRLKVGSKTKVRDHAELRTRGGDAYEKSITSNSKSIICQAEPTAHDSDTCRRAAELDTLGVERLCGVSERTGFRYTACALLCVF